MKLNLSATCDVLVLGSGIAGVSAALSAAESGASVILCCKGNLFSGSSFYPGTWGLGLIGPADADDEQDLADTIQSVGCGMTDDALVHALVSGIHPAIEKVRNIGVKLRRADHGAQKEFIPCFDHKHRDWNGLEFDSVRQVFSERLDALGDSIMDGWEAIELVKADNRVCGAILSNDTKLNYVGCKALVLATGGYGSLFQYHLCTSDVEGLGQALALDAGCKLVNMEFMQIMPGYLSPAYQTIFNEKTFRFTQLQHPDGTPLLHEHVEGVLSIRSGHGPFTTRLPSKAVDYAIYEAWQQDARGVKITYSDDMKRNPPEFVTTYFDWLTTAKGLTMDDPIYVGLFAHAANGGIWISPNAETGVPGLYAAGEVTGGMHGADRIGGLSTANGLVFGGKAGTAAAAAAKAQSVTPPQSWMVEELGITNSTETLRTLQGVMSRSNLVRRTEAGLTEALDAVAALEDGLHPMETAEPAQISQLRRIKGQLLTAKCILTASRMRQESRGSHDRADYPSENKLLAQKLCIRKSGTQISAQFV